MADPNNPIQEPMIASGEQAGTAQAPVENKAARATAPSSHPDSTNDAIPQAIPTQNLSTSGLAIAGMVLGIIALTTIPLPVINFGSPALAIIGLILSIIGFNSTKKGAKKGKGIAIAGIVLCAIVTALALIVSAACSAAVSSSDSSSAGVQASSTAATAGDRQTASGASVNSSAVDYKAAFVGTWDMTAFKSGDTTYDEKLLEQNRKNGTDSYITLNEDGTANLIVGTQITSCTWEATSDTAGYIKTSSNQSSMSISDGVLAIGSANDHMLFKKGKARDSLPTESSASSSSASASSAASGEMSADLKEWLDSYEAFVDEYVEFMKNYQESGDTMSMLSDYTDYMQRYSEYLDKTNKLDTSKMSAADYAYYIEVTTRISKKILEVSGL